jgi:NDP-sugar pyrophosphorylase family protein
MQIVIPMAGKASRFKTHEIKSPKPLLDVFGIPLAARAAQSIQNFGNNQYLFISLVEHKKWDIESRIKEYFPNSKFIYLKEPTRSPVETCLAAASELNQELPVVFNDCDHIFKCPEFDHFLMKQETSVTQNGSILYFKSNDPRFSYIKTSKNGNNEYVQSAIEKQVISGHAVCGTYFFKSVDIFQQLSRNKLKYISKREVFMIELIDLLAKTKGDVTAFKTTYHKSLGTPEEYNEAIKDIAFRKLLT